MSDTSEEGAAMTAEQAPAPTPPASDPTPVATTETATASVAAEPVLVPVPPPPATPPALVFPPRLFTTDEKASIAISAVLHIASKISPDLVAELKAAYGI